VTLRRILLALGGIALLVAVIGLLVPVSVRADDGASIGCGNAVVADTSAAQQANDRSVAGIPILNELVPHDDYVAMCDAAVSSRRSWTIPVAVLGGLVLVGALFVPDRRLSASGTR